MNDPNYPTTQAHIEAWENAKRVMLALTPHERRHHFRMDTYFEKTDCGTSCCVAGFCAFDPYFHALGLKITYGEDMTFPGSAPHVHWVNPRTSDSIDSLDKTFLRIFGRCYGHIFYLSGDFYSILAKIEDLIVTLKEEVNADPNPPSFGNDHDRG